MVIDQTPRIYATHARDLPARMPTGETRDVAVREMDAVGASHMESLRKHGEPVPTQCSTAATVDVVVAE